MEPKGSWRAVICPDNSTVGLARRSAPGYRLVRSTATALGHHVLLVLYRLGVFSVFLEPVKFFALCQPKLSNVGTRCCNSNLHRSLR